ncbi:MAG: MFS transporter, partial [Gammaproteobacteria bacterium]|nr:MFS transporter [Gammaproteobacteria bacterium]
MTSTNPIRAWLVTLTASLFFFYEFIQMLMPNSLRPDLMAAFHIEATQLGFLSSSYFWANVIFLFPAGIILDRFSTKRVVLVSLALCVIGTFCFSQATTLLQASIFRFFEGIGSAFCFLSCIRLATRWLPSNHLALASGLIVTMAFIGGAVAQAPFAWMIEQVGWRQTVVIDSALGVAIWFLILLIVKDRPYHVEEAHQQELQQLHALGFWHSLRLSYLRWQNWFAGIYTNMLNLPIFILGGIWGGGFLIQAHNLSTLQAASLGSFILIGALIGSPLAGWTSDKMGRRKLPMVIGAIISFIITMLILYGHNFSYATLIALYFFVGLFTSSQIISYPLVAESNSALLTATSVSVVSFNVISGGAIFQPVVGYLLDKGWD